MERINNNSESDKWQWPEARPWSEPLGPVDHEKSRDKKRQAEQARGKLSLKVTSWSEPLRAAEAPAKPIAAEPLKTGDPVIDEFDRLLRLNKIKVSEWDAPLDNGLVVPWDAPLGEGQATPRTAQEESAASVHEYFDDEGSQFEDEGDDDYEYEEELEGYGESPLDEDVRRYEEERDMVLHLTRSAPEIYAPTEVSAKMAHVFEQMTKPTMERIKAEYDKDIITGDAALMDFLVQALGLRKRPTLSRHIAPKWHSACGGLSGQLGEPIVISDGVNGIEKPRYMDDAEYASFMEKYRQTADPEDYEDMLDFHVEMVAHETWHQYQAQAEEDLMNGTPSDPEAQKYADNHVDYIDQSDSSVLYRSQIVEAEAYKFGRTVRRRVLDGDYSEISNKLFDGWVPYQEMIETTPEAYRAKRIEDEKLYERMRAEDEEYERALREMEEQDWYLPEEDADLPEVA